MEDTKVLCVFQSEKQGGRVSVKERLGTIIPPASKMSYRKKPELKAQNDAKVCLVWQYFSSASQAGLIK